MKSSNDRSGTIRKQLVEIGKKLDDKGFVIGPGGNTSARCGQVIYMKASGISFDSAETTDYVGVDLKTGKVVDGAKRPTCEILTHLGCYQVREDIGAVVHSHPPLSVGYGMLGTTLKPFTPEMVAILCSDVPTIKPIVTSGATLAMEVKKAIRNHNAVFLANHGLIVVGANLREAYYRTLLIEDSVKSVVAAKILGKMRYYTRREVRSLDESEFEKYRRKLLRKK